MDLDRVYDKILTKKKLIKLIKGCYDKEFIIVMLPRAKNNFDLLIRSKAEEFK